MVGGRRGGGEGRGRRVEGGLGFGEVVVVGEEEWTETGGREGEERRLNR